MQKLIEELKAKEGYDEKNEQGAEVRGYMADLRKLQKEYVN